MPSLMLMNLKSAGSRDRKRAFDAVFLKIPSDLVGSVRTSPWNLNALAIAKPQSMMEPDLYEMMNKKLENNDSFLMKESSFLPLCQTKQIQENIRKDARFGKRTGFAAVGAQKA